MAFVNQARAAFIVTPDAENEDRYLLMPSKMNNAPIKHGLAYRIGGRLIYGSDNEEILTSEILWESTPVKITADQALAAHAGGGDQKSARREAEEFLTDTLSDGPVPQKDIKAAAEGAGLSWATIRRAKDRLGVKPQKAGMDGGWTWQLPKVLKSAEDAHVPDVSTFGVDEHLRDPEGEQ